MELDQNQQRIDNEKVPFTAEKYQSEMERFKAKKNFVLGQAIANLSEIIATLGAENSAPEVAALAKASSEKVQALLQPMDMVKRELYNPTTSASITFCSAFISQTVIRYRNIFSKTVNPYYRSLINSVII